MKRLTPGQRALQEAARLEAARVYGGVISDTTTEPVSVLAARAEAEVKAANQRARANRPRKPEPISYLITAARNGMTTSQIVEHYAVNYATARAASKAAMKDGAA